MCVLYCLKIKDTFSTTTIHSLNMELTAHLCVAGAFWRRHGGANSVQWRSGGPGTAAGGLHSGWQLLHVCRIDWTHAGLHSPCWWQPGKWPCLFIDTRAWILRLYCLHCGAKQISPNFFSDCICWSTTSGLYSTGWYNPTGDFPLLHCLLLLRVNISCCFRWIPQSCNSIHRWQCCCPVDRTWTQPIYTFWAMSQMLLKPFWSQFPK